MVLGFLGIVISSCGSARCPTTPHKDAAAALSSLSRMREPLQTLRAEATVQQWGKKGRIRGTVWMLLKKPDRIRFDAMTAVGPVAVLTSNGETFSLTDLRENLFVSGKPCASNVSRLLGVQFSASEAARFLFGDVPRIKHERRSIMCRDDGGYRVELFAADGKVQSIDLDVRKEDIEEAPERQRLRVVRSELRSASGKVRWRAAFSDFREVSDKRREGYGFSLPHRVKIEDKVRGSELRMKFRSIDANINLEASSFMQQPRPGLETRTSVCE